MGTSLTSVRGNGFWTRDSPLVTWLALLVVELGRGEAKTQLKPLLEQWTREAAIPINGCISPELDQYLHTGDDIALVLAGAERVLTQLEHTADDEVSPAREEFGQRVHDLLGEHYEHPSALRSWVLNIGRAFVMLLKGELDAPLDGKSSYFVGSDAGHYLGDPPERVVRRWLYEAERAESEPHTYEALMLALEKTVHPFWQVTSSPASAPALATIVCRTHTAPQPALTIVVSRIGGFLCGVVRGRLGPTWRELTDMTPVASSIFGVLASSGWRHIPTALLVKPYDGIHSRANERRSWATVLFGERAAG